MLPCRKNRATGFNPRRQRKPPRSVAEQPNVRAPEHETLAELQQWLAVSAHLPLASAKAKRILPHGPENATIMLLAMRPRLRIMRPGGRSAAMRGSSPHACWLRSVRMPEQAYSASLSPIHAPGARLSERDRDDYAEIARRHIRLVKPKRLLLSSAMAQRLRSSGNRVARARAQVHKIEGVRAVATFHPRHLIKRPLDKSTGMAGSSASDGGRILKAGLIALGTLVCAAPLAAQTACLTRSLRFLRRLGGRNPTNPPTPSQKPTFSVVPDHPLWRPSIATPKDWRGVFDAIDAGNWASAQAGIAALPPSVLTPMAESRAIHRQGLAGRRPRVTSGAHRPGSRASRSESAWIDGAEARSQQRPAGHPRKANHRARLRAGPLSRPPDPGRSRQRTSFEPRSTH